VGGRGGVGAGRVVTVGVSVGAGVLVGAGVAARAGGVGAAAGGVGAATRPGGVEGPGVPVGAGAGGAAAGVAGAAGAAAGPGVAARAGAVESPGVAGGVGAAPGAGLVAAGADAGRAAPAAAGIVAAAAAGVAAAGVGAAGIVAAAARAAGAGIVAVAAAGVGAAGVAAASGAAGAVGRGGLAGRGAASSLALGAAWPGPVCAPARPRAKIANIARPSIDGGRSTIAMSATPAAIRPIWSRATSGCVASRPLKRTSTLTLCPSSRNLRAARTRTCRSWSSVRGRIRTSLTSDTCWFFFASRARLSDSNLNLPRSAIRQTGGSAVAATSIRSSPASSARRMASSIGMTPICWPSASRTRTSGTRIWRLVRGPVGVGGRATNGGRGIGVLLPDGLH